MLLAVLPDLPDLPNLAILLAAVPAGLLLVAVINLGLSVANERRRTQPIAIAHELTEPSLSKESGVWLASAGAYLTNDGQGAAFNVRFGIELHAVRHPYRMQFADPTTGDRTRVLGKGERVPPRGPAPIFISSVVMQGVAMVPDPGRAYWARYENAQGKTWETRNPVDRSAHLEIRRVWFVRAREWLEARRRRRAAEKAAQELRRAAAGATGGAG